MDGCICVSNELVDPDFPALWEEIAASASGRSFSSSWLKLNCLTSRFLRLVLVLDLGCRLSGVGLRSCRCGILSAVRLDAAESWEELWYLSMRVSFEFFPLGVGGASFFIVEERRILLFVTLHKDDMCRLSFALVLTLKAASIWALMMLHLRWSGSIAGETGGWRDFSESCFSSPLLSMLTCSEGQGGESLSDSRALSGDWEMSNSSAGQGGARRSNAHKV